MEFHVMEPMTGLICTDLKAFVSDVKPALQSALDAEYEKNPYEVKYLCMYCLKSCTCVYLRKNMLFFFSFMVITHLAM